MGAGSLVTVPDPASHFPARNRPYFFFVVFNMSVAAILASPSTMLDLVRIAPGQIVPAAFVKSASSSSVIFRVAETVLLAMTILCPDRPKYCKGI
jgi:hypothetical protein